MLLAQVTPGCATTEIAVGAGCALGWCSTSDRAAPFPFVRRSPSGNLLIVTGTPVATHGTIDAALARAADLDGAAASVILTDLDGAFAILHWDAAQRVVTLVTDFLGVQPLHLSRAPGAFYCCTNLRGLTGSGLVTARPDPGAWGSFFVLGHTLGDRTLVEGIERAPPASVLRVRAEDAREQRREYWQWRDLPPGSSHPATGPFAEALQRSVQGYREYGHAGTVLLSGGFASRLVLHALLYDGIRAHALVVRGSNCADAYLGRRAAEAVGLHPHLVKVAGDQYGGADYREYLHRSELPSPHADWLVARAIDSAAPAAGCVWDGLCMQSLRCLPGAPTSFAAYLEQPSFRARGLVTSPAPFRLAWAQAMYEGFARLLREETAKYGDGECGVARFCLRNRTRLRSAATPYRVLAIDALPFTPGLTREYCELTARLTPGQQGEHRLIERICRDYFPRALRVPFVSRGQLVNLSGRRSWQFTCLAVVPGVIANRYVAHALRWRTERRQAHRVPERSLHVLTAMCGDDCIDERALHGPTGTLAAGRLRCWSTARTLFQPALPPGMARGNAAPAA
jgi:hypothetical protein